MDRRQFNIMSSPMIGRWLQGSPASAAARDSESTDPPPPPRLTARTLGGKQFWADEWFFHTWRIQRNALTGHHRLLDGTNRRHASGTFETCRQRLEVIRTERRLPLMRGTAVVVLHGLFRTRTSMASLCQYLHEHGRHQVFNISYPSTRGTVGDHARSLARVMQSLEGIEKIDVVAHSLGNLIIRHYLADATGASNGRLHRMVMLGPPNQGAKLAEKLMPLDVTRQLTGAAAQQLARGWDELAPRLATPPFEFGILAGGSRNGRGRNPFVAGDDDWIVTVESTKLAGARDFRVLPVWHITMMNDPTVHAYTLRFLQQGYFESEKKRQPIDGGPEAK